MNIETYSAMTGRQIKEDNTVVNIADLQEAMSGQDTGKRINTTATIAPDSGKVFVAIKALSNTQINTAIGNISNFNGAILLAGDIVVGRWTSLNITTGDCIAYQMGV